MPWHGSLHLDYRLDSRQTPPRTVAHDRHDGPLRILASLYPEGHAVCHNVLVHPPGGLVGGDELHIHATLQRKAHALITTPGATRFYRSTGAPATQVVDMQVADEARLEWLPLETLVYNAAIGHNRVRFDLAPGAEMIGWDLVALGLPASNQAFEQGRYTQEIDLPGAWLERGTIDADDRRLLGSPLGLNGHRAISTMWFATGSPMSDARRALLAESARDLATASSIAGTAGVTSPNDRLVVLRALAGRVEPAMALMQGVWVGWREGAWQMGGGLPRVWRT